MKHELDCITVRSHLDALVRGELPRHRALEVEDHLGGCADCAAARDEAVRLLAALRAMPVPEMTPGFAQAALARAIAAADHRVVPFHAARPAQESRHAPRRRSWSWLGMVGGAVAAGLLALAVLGPPRGLPQPDPAVEMAPTLRLALFEPREIALAIDADEAMPGARLTLSISGGIELVGFGDTRELHWETDLDAGTNVLPLPVIARSLEQGRLTARVEHGEQSRQFDFTIQPEDPAARDQR